MKDAMIINNQLYWVDNNELYILKNNEHLKVADIVESASGNSDNKKLFNSYGGKLFYASDGRLRWRYLDGSDNYLDPWNEEI